MAEKPLSDSEIRKFRQQAIKPPTPKDSVKQMQDDGFGVATPAGQSALKTMRDRYSGDFRNFFVALNKRYDKTEDAGDEVTRIRGVLERINSLVILIDRLLNTSSLIQAKNDGIKLDAMVSELTNDFNYFVDASKLTEVMSENFEDIAKKSNEGVSFEKIAGAQAILSRKTKEITKQPTIGSKVAGLAKTIGSVASSIATIDYMGGGGSVRESIAKKAERKQGIEDAEFAEAGENIGTTATAQDMPEEDDSAMGAYSRAGGGVGGGGGDLERALFKFFNGRAMKAKWTMALLASTGGDGIQDSGAKDGGRGGMGMGMAALIPQIMKVMGPAMAVMFAGQAGWMLGRAIGKIELGGKTIDERVEGAGLAMMGGDVDARMKKKAKKAKKEAKKGNIQPLMARAMELQAENPEMTSGEAAKVAWAEKMEAEGDATPSESLGIQEKEIEIPSESIGTKAVESSVSAGAGEKLPDGIVIDPATGMYMDEKTGATGSTISIAQDNAQQPKYDAINKAGSEGGGKVPIDTVSAEDQKMQKDATEQLNESIKIMNESLKEGSKGGSKPAGYDANNTRNPIMSSLGAGQLSN